MVCGNKCECRIPEKDLLRKRGKNFKNINDRGEPEPNLKTDYHNLLKIPEKDNDHSEEKTEGVCKQLLDQIDDWNENKKWRESISGNKQDGKKYGKCHYKGNCF